MKYEDWLYDWLENYAAPTVKHTTYNHYAAIVKNRLKPDLGTYELSDITPYVLQKYVTGLLQNGNRITGSGLSPNTVNGIIHVIQNSLKTAVDAGLLERYAADKVRRPKAQEKEITCFTCEEQKKIESDILGGKRYRLYGILLCLYTGLRIGELLALEWADIDLQKRLLTVSKSCYFGKNKDGIYARVVGTPKTNSSRRQIPIPKQLIPLLRQIKWQGSRYVISNKGQPISTRSYQRTFALLLKRLHIPHKGFHTLRHTFATRALECGMDVKSLSEILGHRSPTVTLNRYAHSLMEYKRDMMNRLGKRLTL